MSLDDKTPTRKGAAVSDTSLELAGTAIALSTAATRLRNAADIADAAAVRSAEASRLVDDYGPAARSALLRDIEEQLGDLAEAVHDTRRAVRATRLAMEKTP